MTNLKMSASRAFRVRPLLLLALGVMLGFASPAAAIEAPQNFVLRDVPQPLPEIVFADGDGKPGSLADFRGKVVLLNIWATWCLPCRKEMPTLDRLQAKLGGPDFEVVALSMDRKGATAVRKFFAEIGVTHVSVRVDTSRKAANAVGGFGLPITLLLDRQGRELGRLEGPADWNAPEMIDFLKTKIAQQDGPGLAAQPEEKH